MTMMTEFQKLLRDLPGYSLRKTMQQRYILNKLKSKTSGDREKWRRLATVAICPEGTNTDDEITSYEIIGGD